MFSVGNLVFTRMNLKAAALKNVVFDREMRFRPCEVCHFQNLLCLELPIKQALNVKSYDKENTL